MLRGAVLPEDEPEGVDDALAASSPLEDEIWALAREVAADRSTANIPDDQLRIAVATEIGALPPLNRELTLGIRDPEVKKIELEERTLRVNGLRALLSELILGPARLVSDYLMPDDLCRSASRNPVPQLPAAGYARRSALGEWSCRLGPFFTTTAAAI